MTPTGKEAMQAWRAEFHKTVHNPTAPECLVDMWMLRDDETGETIVSLGVPHGDQDTPYLVARAVNSYASTRELIGELVGALEEAFDTRAPDYVNAEDRDWSTRARAVINKAKSHPAIGGE